KDPEGAAAGRVPRQVAHRVDEAAARGLIAGIQADGDDGARPAADAVEDGDVLLAAGTAKGDGLADDSRGGLELPQQLAGARVHGLEPAVHGAVEDDVAGGGQRAAPDGEALAQRPRRALGHRIPRRKGATLAPGAGVHPHDRADVRRAGDIARVHRLEVHAEVLVRDVEEAGAWRPRRRLPVLGAGRGGAYVAHDLAEHRRFFSVDGEAARREIHAPGGVDVRERGRREHLAGRPVHDVDVAVALGPHEDLTPAALDLEVDEDLLIHGVVVEHVVWRELIGPHRLAGGGPAR